MKPGREPGLSTTSSETSSRTTHLPSQTAAGTGVGDTDSSAKATLPSHPLAHPSLPLPSLHPSVLASLSAQLHPSVHIPAPLRPPRAASLAQSIQPPSQQPRISQSIDSISALPHLPAPPQFPPHDPRMYPFFGGQHPAYDLYGMQLPQIPPPNPFFPAPPFNSSLPPLPWGPPPPPMLPIHSLYPQITGAFPFSNLNNPLQHQSDPSYTAWRATLSHLAACVSGTESSGKTVSTSSSHSDWSHAQAFTSKSSQPSDTSNSKPDSNMGDKADLAARSETRPSPQKSRSSTSAFAKVTAPLTPPSRSSSRPSAASASQSASSAQAIAARNAPRLKLGPYSPVSDSGSASPSHSGGKSPTEGAHGHMRKASSSSNSVSTSSASGPKRSRKQSRWEFPIPDTKGQPLAIPDPVVGPDGFEVYTCMWPECKRSFLTRLAIRRHTKKHVNGRQYKCSECSRRFVDSTGLRRHRRVHTGERPYVCQWPGCGKQFADSSNAKRHALAHQTKPFFMFENNATVDKPVPVPYKSLLAPRPQSKKQKAEAEPDNHKSSIDSAAKSEVKQAADGSDDDPDCTESSSSDQETGDREQEDHATEAAEIDDGGQDADK